MTWKRATAVLPGVGVALLPKLSCPMCWPAYAALLSTLGLGFLISERYLFALTSALLCAAVAALAFRASERRGYGPAVLGLVAAVVILASKFSWDSAAVMYSGVGLLLTSSVWNSIPRTSWCSKCVPSAPRLIEVNAREKA